jgi:serine/threonine-protein kinase
MELLEGRSFGSLLDECSRITAVKAVQILLPIIEALAYAHEQGIVHRDLKPENVFLAREGKKLQPKIVDFGIAKLSQNEIVSNRTLGGVVLGTPAYMAPEQARGLEDVDQRVDTWAVCVVLYEAITGEQPFRGENYNAMMLAVIEEDPPSFAARGIHEPELWEILRRGLQKKRDERWQSMRELGVALASWLSSRGIAEDVSGEPLQDTWLSQQDGSGFQYAKTLMSLETPPRGSAPELRSNEPPPWSVTWMRPALGSLKITNPRASAPPTSSTLRPVPLASKRLRWLASGVVAVALVSGGATWLQTSTDSAAKSPPKSGALAPPQLPRPLRPVEKVEPASPTGQLVRVDPASPRVDSSRSSAANAERDAGALGPSKAVAKDGDPPRPAGRRGQRRVPVSDLKDPY